MKIERSRVMGYIEKSIYISMGLGVVAYLTVLVCNGVTEAIDRRKMLKRYDIGR